MKRLIVPIFFLAGLLITVPYSGMAEKEKSHQQGGRFLQKMVRHLNLTEDQISKAQSLGEQFAQEVATVHEKYQARIAEILTPEQKSKWEELQKKGKGAKARFSDKSDRQGDKEGLKEKRLDHGKRGFSEKLAKELGLSEEQQTRMKALQSEFQAEMQKSREQMMEKRKAFRERMSAILTPEQKSKLEELKKERNEKFRDRMGKAGESARAGRVDRLSKALDLNPAQTDQVKGILDDQRKEMQALVQKYIERLRPILTPEQQQKLDELGKFHQKR
ncbi:MAG: hypothetical protein HYU64_00585 [Armatimonadetes bacterium]|nr:hypothetical protein [Armatimonadota bacterium]